MHSTRCSPSAQPARMWTGLKRSSSCRSGAQCCLWSPDLGAKLLPPSWRHSPRVAAPTEKACDLHNTAPCAGSICGRPALGAKLLAPSWRHSPRVAAPTENACDLHNAAPCTGWICRSPDPGAKLLAPSWRHSPRVAAPAAKACDVHNAAPCTGCIVGGRLGAKLLAPSWRHSPRGEALSDRAAHANAGSSAGRTRSAHSPASCVRRACRRRGCARFRADAPAHGRRSFAGTPAPLP